MIKFQFTTFFLFLFLLNINGQQVILDDFNNLNGWKIVKSDGVKTRINSSQGKSDKALELNFDFTHGTGYCGVQKEIFLELPENFEFSFYLKSKMQKNNLEFKLLDSTGQNVWWNIKRNYDFPEHWKKITIKKRDISFAWGPTQDKSLHHIYKIEFTVSSATGGKGKLFLDSLLFRKLPSPPLNPPPIKVFASSFQDGYRPELVLDNNPGSKWLSDDTLNSSHFLTFDFGYKRELGGLIIKWAQGLHPSNFAISTSNDNLTWEKIKIINGNTRTINFIQLPNPTARFYRISVYNKTVAGIADVEFQNYKFSENPNYFFQKVANHYPEGYFPRYLYGQQSYWTVCGTDSDEKEALFNEDGMLEIDKQNFSIVPFVKYKGIVYSWNNANKNTSLAGNYMPLPSVTWNFNNFNTKFSPLSYKEKNTSVLSIDYQISNTSDGTKNLKLYLAFMPFQVIPPWQSLNFTGGFVPIKHININNNTIQINNNMIYLSKSPEIINVMNFETHGIYDFFNMDPTGEIQTNPDKDNNLSYVVATYDLTLKAKEKQTITVSIPYGRKTFEQVNFLGQKTIEYWKKKLNRVIIKLPGKAQKFVDVLKSNLAYILINKDGPKIQPGSRTYERSWIRDGALTSTALLEFGFNDEVKEFIKWYRQYLFPNGKVPCVVDSRGPDPVDENDSNGEFIYLISQHFKFTGDTTFLKSNLPYIIQSVNYIKKLISKRTSSFYANGNDSIKALYGLVPESISHEGYSAHPVHSYWDDFFVLLGLKRAKEIASALGKDSLFNEYSLLENNFRKNLVSSIRIVTKYHNIDFIPGSVELGDFDPTSTAISIFPCFEQNNLPYNLLRNTFDKYYNFFKNRISSTNEWQNFTPYELRIVAAFNILGEKERALDLLSFFMKYRRPREWNEWAEIVWKNYREPKFIGDMPHTWVGSGFINSFRSLLCYEDENTKSLVLAPGIDSSWIEKPMSVEQLPTYYGKLTYRISKNKNGNCISIQLDGLQKMPEGGIIIKNIFKTPIKSVLANEETVTSFTGEEIIIKNVPPVNVKIYY